MSSCTAQVRHTSTAQVDSGAGTPHLGSVGALGQQIYVSHTMYLFAANIPTGHFDLFISSASPNVEPRNLASGH